MVIDGTVPIDFDFVTTKFSAWELCVKFMVEGEVCSVRTSPRFAYGELGLQPDIGSNLQMEYTVIGFLGTNVYTEYIVLDRSCEHWRVAKFSRNDRRGDIGFCHNAQGPRKFLFFT